MDDRYGRPFNRRMEQNRPGFKNRLDAQQGTCAKTDRGPQRTEGPGMNMGSPETRKTFLGVNPSGAVRSAKQMGMNVTNAQMKTARFANQDDRSPYLANDICDAREAQMMRGDPNRNRFYADNRAEMRNRCLENNRGPQKDGEFLGWKNRGPQAGDTRTMNQAPQAGNMRSVNQASQPGGMKTMNRGPQKAEDVAFKNRSPQKTEMMGTGGTQEQGSQDRMRMKNICGYRNRRPGDGPKR